MRGLILIALAVAGCERASSAPTVTIDLDTAPGLSGLDVGDDGVLWTVAERDGAAYRIVLDHDRVASLARVPLEPAPRADLESIDVVGTGVFFFGLEGAQADSAAFVSGLITEDDTSIGVMRPTPLRPHAKRVLEANKGVEGVCSGDTIRLFAFEAVVDEDGARFAQVEVHRPDTPAVHHRVRLTTRTGKISGLDCRPAAGATSVDVLAIERHFEVTRIISFPIDLTGPSTVDAVVVRDLADVADGRNFEGIARLPDGRIALVTDNQWRTIEGPSQLVLLPATK